MTEDDFDPRSMEELRAWHESAYPCPKCAAVMLTGSWWDDHPNDGGACIGELRRCTSETCDYDEQL